MFLLIAPPVATLELWANPRPLQFACLYSLTQMAVKNDLLEIINSVNGFCFLYA